MKISVVMLMAMAVPAGCQSQAKPPAQPASPTVLNVTAPRPHQPSVYAMPYAMPMATPAAYVAPAGAGVPAYLPPGGGDSVAPAAATIPFAPVPAIEQAPSHAAPTIKLAKSESKTYVVKPGDTLFRIARNRYGEGSAWHNIAAANPGLSPATLKAGQTLVMP